MDNLADMLRTARRKAGLRQRDLAAAVGVTCCYLSKVENGHYRPSTRTTMRLAARLGLDPLALLVNRRDVPPELRSLTAAQWGAISEWLRGVMTAAERNGRE